MYKSHLFLLLSGFRYYEAEKEQGSAKEEAQKVRDAIKVENIKAETKEPIKEEIKETEETDIEEVEEVEETEETEEVKELTPAEYKAQVAKLEKTIARLQKRRGKDAGEKDTIKQQLAEATASLSAKVEEGQGLSEEEVERRANLKADEKTTEREFNKAVANLNKGAKKADPEFSTKIKELTEDIAPVPGAMIGILEDLDNENGGAVLAYLASNPEQYEEIFELPISRMSNRLNKISDKLIEDTKPKKKAISKAPEPIKGIKGNDKSPNILPSKPTENMDEYVRMRNAQDAQRRKERYG